MKSSENYLVSIIIPTYNRLPLLKKTLFFLFNQTTPKYLFEIIVVDDGSQDNTALYLQAMTEEYENLKKIIHQHNSGPAKTRNDGINIASGEFIIFLDDDMEIPKDFINQHVQFLKKNDCTLQLVKIIFPDKIKRKPFVRYLNSKGLYNLKEGIDLPWKDFTTGNVSMKRKYLTEYGGFDENFTSHGWEDQELGLTLLKHGLHLRYNPKITIVHNYYPTLKEYCHKMETAGKNALLLYRKHPYDYVANFFRLSYLKSVFSKKYNFFQKIKAICIKLLFNNVTIFFTKLLIKFLEAINLYFLLTWLYPFVIGYHHLKGIKRFLKQIIINEDDPLVKFIR